MVDDVDVAALIERVEGAGLGLRVLFLDIDGVVLNGRALWATGNNRHLPPVKIALIREVCDRTGCVIVVSSTWRYSDTTADMLRHAGLPLHADWRTDWRNDYVGSLIVGQRRGMEIFRWLAKHPDVSYAIIDDDSDMLPEQRDRFVQTKFEDGVERDHVERLVGIFEQSAHPRQDNQGDESK
jgi:hypothetical protein